MSCSVVLMSTFLEMIHKEQLGKKEKIKYWQYNHKETN